MNLAHRRFARKNRLFSLDSAKAVKADKYGWMNAIHYLAPGALSGRDVCPSRTEGCTALCLGEHSGYASFSPNVLVSRIAKTRRFFSDRKTYIGDLNQAIFAIERKAARLGKKVCVRLNGSSDIVWDGVAPQLFTDHPDVQFVEYTKIASRFNRPRPANLHLTFSRSETNEADCRRLLARGVNVAVVFAGARPATYMGSPVIDGDLHDLRHLDPRSERGFVIGLSPKGRRAKADASGFVVRDAA